MSDAPSKPVSFSRPKVGYFSHRPRILVYMKGAFVGVANEHFHTTVVICQYLLPIYVLHYQAPTFRNK